ncbi:MAG: hypothetical protein KGZ94_07700 [Clostridia bacterium]|nr:hypothetical protein [Clostridia bacterium]
MHGSSRLLEQLHLEARYKRIRMTSTRTTENSSRADAAWPEVKIPQ